MAAALGGLVARLTKTDPSLWDQHRAFFAAAMQQDAEAFASVMRTSEPSSEALIHATATPLVIAERALELGSALRGALASCPRRFASDLETAVGLAAAAVRGAAATAALNLESLDPGPVRTRLEARLRALQ
jgi:formiminotetrahydrofolate cyclodeaminase